MILLNNIYYLDIKDVLIIHRRMNNIRHNIKDIDALKSIIQPKFNFQLLDIIQIGSFIFNNLLTAEVFINDNCRISIGIFHVFLLINRYDFKYTNIDNILTKDDLKFIELYRIVNLLSNKLTDCEKLCTLMYNLIININQKSNPDMLYNIFKKIIIKIPN